MSLIGVYGANGFIGQHLVRRLAGAGWPVRAVSRHVDERFMLECGKVEFLEADLFEPLAMASSLQGVHTVIQLISTSSPGMENHYVVADIRENVIPHIEFLRSCLLAGVRRYLFLSSGGTVYGPGAPLPTREADATKPICSHGLTKLMMEKYVQMYGELEGLEFVILRVSNLFGPGQKLRKSHGLIPAILDCLRQNKPLRIFGDGAATRDYLYIDDAIDALEAALALDNAPQLVLNIGSGETRSVIEVIETIQAASNYRFECEYAPARKTDVAASCLDISEARAVLGWTPRTPFAEGIRKTLSSIEEPALS